jgi:Ca2+-binding RTX toxin-like protein
MAADYVFTVYSGNGTGASNISSSNVQARTQVVLTGNSNNETLTGGALNDTIDGGAGNDSLVGGLGADSFILTGGGVDTVVGGTAGDSLIASADTLATTIAAGNTLTFANGLDIITGFGSTDILDVATASVAPTNLVGATAATALVSNTSYVLYGNYNATTKVFTVAATFDSVASPDALVAVGNGTLTAITTTGYVLLDDLTALLASGNFG